jgi:hypothetical protein
MDASTMNYEPPQSFLSAMKMQQPTDNGQIVIGMSIKEIPPYERKTAADYFDGKDYDKAYSNFIVAGTLLQTGEMLLLPQEYRYCSVLEKHEQFERPANGYVNSEGVMKILNLDHVSTEYPK